MKSQISKEMTTETVQWTPIDEVALAASSSRPSPNQDEKSRKKSQDEENEDLEDDAIPSRNWGTTFRVEWIKVYVCLLQIYIEIIIWILLVIYNVYFYI